MQHSNIRAVFLDAGDTLFRERAGRPSMYAEVATAHGGIADAAAARSALESAVRDLPSSVEGNFRYSLAWFRAFNERVMETCGVDAARHEAAHEELVRRFTDPRSYQVFEEVPEVLEELVGRGFQIGVVSNWSEALPALLEGLGIGASISFVVTSADLRAEKPDRAIFERALFRAGTAADEAVHVGDHFEKDVRGALNAGMRAVLVDRDAETADDREGVPVIGDLRDLLQLLEAHTVRT